ncbi:indolepyruvate ferredoxin oxidoreductase family protein [Thauera sp.]|uniref:indolepyruvate ferredoxin oxidoreductase family protein n=1 Tax=Thauera sp. TaxID=1905334 RepID=UPI001B468906|nr:indolepyruvate ferredoxin oxidoreductase family protein [Thauera sp.]MBP6131198.1 indolepyruvate ferredoxin oxidoreductase family protein [Thauera sp.]MBP7046758.1 indolepyruvate ferredoxin oxidoreductase family protein [Thauera sp.]
MSSGKQISNTFTQEEGDIHLGGIDAIVRLTLDQVRTDARRGLKTGMFVSGYRGSPVGMLDAALIKQQKLLVQNHIHFVDGINEDLAATAVWGTQMLHTVGKQKFDGVTGMWYGKAPGVDRSGDALKHANYTGIAKNGGVLAIAGDDPSCKSSSLCSQSEPMLFHVGIPSLYPGNVQEILDYGLHGYQMSRLAGVWMGMKIVTNVADGTGTANVSPERLNFVTPDLEFDGKLFTPNMNLGMNVRVEALEMEQSLYTRRLEVVKRYARANNLNNVVFPNPDAWIGILTAGKTYNDLNQAFLEMGLDDAALRRYGIRILKMGMLFPMEPTIVREFAQGLEEIFVIEEKRPFLEMFAKQVLYGMANAPRIVGKFDEEEKELLPHYGEFESDVIVRALLKRLSRKTRIESAENWLKRLDEIHSRNKLPTAVRTAWFCSGCPHNSSTQAPDGSIVSAGIGCHTMAMWMGRNVVMGTHMGAEGTQWIGMAPFTEAQHIFQNMGDGTYAHSGSLAIRYAASTGVNITFKLLRNAHTSMTGGQAIQGEVPVTNMVSDLLANGVKKIIVTTDDPSRFNGVQLPGGTEVWHRDRIEEAQRELAATPGCTVLLHDQECAAELRRARSRGKADEPVEVTVINERVCEGCGDCGEKSNCMSVEPVQTEFGRKTRIHQSSCNKDFSCVKGFCPSFLTITPHPAPAAEGAPKKKKGRIPALERELPPPVKKVDDSLGFGIHVMGIGGTGSVTVVATLARAARLEGKHVIGLDQTGLAQKGGAVISDIKITHAPFKGSNKISDGRADLYLGFDILNATDPKNLDKCNPERTIAVVSTTQTPTGQMVTNRKALFPATSGLTGGIDRVTRKEHNVFLDGEALAAGLFGDAMATNNFMVGVAFQAGTIPLQAESIEDAIRQSGVAVDMSLAAFRWGRMAVVDRAFVEAEVARQKTGGQVVVLNKAPQLSPAARAIVDSIGASGEVKRLVEIRVPELIAFQDEAYAKRYAEVIKRVVAGEQKAVSSSALAEAAARYLYKLMAYKDEFEVARLHTDPAFLAELDAQFPHGYSVKYNLAPPLLSKTDPVTGHPQKKQYGEWMFKAFKRLSGLKRFRGSALDVFGKTEERQTERKLIEEYVQLLDQILARLNPVNHAAAVALASVPDEIRGFGHVKEKNLVAARELQAARLKAFNEAQQERQVA